MFKATRLLLLSLTVGAAGLALAPPSAGAKQFTYDEKTNKQMARQLKIPVYFAVPDSARAPLSDNIDTPDRLIDFQHPEAEKAEAKVGLRLIVAKRAGLAKRLAQSGLVQTGDILLTFRPEWGGVGPYPNVQMGISHTGIAYVKNGTVHNIDNPMDDEFIGSGRATELNSTFYRSIKLIHIIRPRNLTDAQRANLIAWATRLNANAKRVYPGQVAFNQDYSNPKYSSGKPLTFVRHLGQAALGQNPSGKVDMFCSEFAWSLLALRDCDPDKVGDTFKGGGIPSCVRPAMKPCGRPAATSGQEPQRLHRPRRRPARGHRRPEAAGRGAGEDGEVRLHRESQAAAAALRGAPRDSQAECSRLREARTLLPQRSHWGLLGGQGEADEHVHRPVDTGELFAHVVPRQYAAAAQQQQSDHGLRGDHRHPIEAQGLGIRDWASERPVLEPDPP
jgi:hypothetical protein